MGDTREELGFTQETFNRSERAEAQNSIEKETHPRREAVEDVRPIIGPPPLQHW